MGEADTFAPIRRVRLGCGDWHGLRGLAAQRLALVEQVGGAGVECATVLACQVDLGSVTLTMPIFADE